MFFSCLLSQCVAQSTEGTLPNELRDFPVSIVKPNVRNDGRWRAQFVATGYTAMGVTLKQIIQDAYFVYDESRLEGLPKWASTEKLDLDARVDTEQLATFEKLSTEQKQLLLQRLLHQRFGLQAGFEKKAGRQYVLTIAKGGAKLKRSAQAVNESNEKGLWPSLRPGKMVASHVPMGEFARSLGLVLGRPTIDRTGLNDHFDIALEWQPDLDSAGETSGPSVFSALKDQLGLELRLDKAATDVLVVTAVEHPQSN
ncbi:Protein of unknown function (DUF3738) [Terriglobus roseus DSM 18391]|uniref:Soil-associated protein, TIGR03435 family n=1 Tax=Terriglobus roseus (strain DSM 18391 / NRRL B-41598 / KBS 63) TaxID=926566 RepID=I3ZJH7_TERRK|nr:Protein of unknown function (DUF3738) [Terriglobus roseus DSM 18391]